MALSLLPADPFVPFADDQGALLLANGSLRGGREVEKAEAVPLRARKLAGDCAEGAIVLGVELEPTNQDLHDEAGGARGGSQGSRTF